MKRILVTGAKGFIGKNLIVALKRRGNVEVIEYDLDSPAGLLEEGLASADVIYHLAGVNRPERVEEFAEGNFDLTKQICDTLRRLDRAPPTDAFAYALTQRSDPRGELAELLKSPHIGQIFVSRTRQGITRGHHYHDTKVEKFVVLEGDAVIRFRHILGGDVIEYPVSGREFRVVDIPPGYTHSIENVGQNDLIVLFWAAEIFDPDIPDAFGMTVCVNNSEGASMKVMTVVGTRPEIIRLSRVIAVLERYTHHILVHTGQNYDYELNQVFFDDLELRAPDHFLAAAGKTPAETVGLVIAKVDEVLAVEKPDAVLILGDTNSCLAAYPAKRHKIPVFHMEAGNRCFDQRVPEEINRKIVDHISDINMPYSSIGREYLLREGLPPDRVIKTGSPMFEVLHY